MPKLLNQRGAAHLLLIIVLVLGVLAIVGFVGYRVWSARWQKAADKKVEEAIKSTSPGATADQPAPDDQLVGKWETGCLVPDPDSDWAEKHQFVIEGNKATHTRWSNDTASRDCANPTMTLVNNYTITVPAGGQINLFDSEAQATIYDIYKVDGSNLLFGHGFRGDNATYSVNNGDSASTRIESLNPYLVYKKQ